MIIIEKWAQLPTTYTIFFPTTAKFEIKNFFDIIDCVDEADTIVDCIEGAQNIIECMSNGGGGDQEAVLVLVNSSNYHEYSYLVAPYKLNKLYTQFDLTIDQEIECGDYQAFLIINGNPVDTVKFRIVAPQKPYYQYNPNRNITIYER